MASLDNKTKETAGELNEAEMVSMMGMALLDNGGLAEIDKALQSSQDPPQVVGAFMTQLIGQMAEMTTQMGISPNVYLEKGGFLDQTLAYIERKLGLPKEFSDQVYGETLEAIKAAAMEGGGGEPAGGPTGAPTQPQGAPAGPGLDSMGGM
jgi:hypothetical protein